MQQGSPTDFFAERADSNFFRFDLLQDDSPNISVFLGQEELKSPHSSPLKPVTKTIQKSSVSKRKYVNTSDDLRLELINAVYQQGEKIKQAAKRLGINYSSAKAICQIYKREGRSNKIFLKRKTAKTPDLQTSNGKPNIATSSTIEGIGYFAESENRFPGFTTTTKDQVSFLHQPNYDFSIAFMNNSSCQSQCNNLTISQGTQPINQTVTQNNSFSISQQQLQQTTIFPATKAFPADNQLHYSNSTPQIANPTITGNTQTQMLNHNIIMGPQYTQFLSSNQKINQQQPLPAMMSSNQDAIPQTKTHNQNPGFFYNNSAPQPYQPYFIHQQNITNNQMNAFQFIGPVIYVIPQNNGMPMTTFPQVIPNIQGYGNSQN